MPSVLAPGISNVLSASMNLTILGTSYKSNQTVFVSIYKEIQPVHPKGDQSWVFIGRTDAEAETPVLWPCHAKS